MNKIINPDSTIIQQLDGQWQRVAMQVIWKLARRKGVKITEKDMESLVKAFEPDGPVLLTHGYVDGIEFKLVNIKTAKRLAEYDAQMKGSA